MLIKGKTEAEQRPGEKHPAESSHCWMIIRCSPELRAVAVASGEDVGVFVCVWAEEGGHLRRIPGNSDSFRLSLVVVVTVDWFYWKDYAAP